MLKTFNIDLDLENQTAFNVFSVSQGDLNSIIVNLTLSQDGKPLNLTGCTVRIVIRKPSGLTLLKDCTMKDAPKGMCSVNLDTQANVELGNYMAELYVYSGDSVAVTGTFTYSSRATILNDNAVESSNEWQSINVKISEAQGILDDLRENGTGIDAEARADILEVDEKLRAELGVKANVSYVDNQVTTLDTKLNSQASGSPKGVYTTVSALQTAHPTGNSNIYVVTADGKWYYWNGTTWTGAGTYQSTGIADNSIERRKLDPDLKDSVSKKYVDDSVEYAIVDKDNKQAFAIDKYGNTIIQSLQIPDSSLEERTLKGVLERNEEVTEITWGIIDANKRMSDLVIGRDGKIPQFVLDDWKERMNVAEEEQPSLRAIACWGDSLTGGAAGVPSSQLWAGLLAPLTGRTVYNMGVGGETSATIAYRQGALSGYINNITIPADNTTTIEIANSDTKPIVDEWGHTVAPIRQQQPEVNPVYIAGVEGTLTISGDDKTWYFKRTSNGEAVTINRPTPVIPTSSMRHREDIMIIFIGQNGGYDNNEQLIQQIKFMIDRNQAQKKEYLVLGFTTGTRAERKPLDDLMLLNFGRRFVNLREYMTTYGLADEGITPTQQDLDFMAQGKTPPSLLATSLGGSNASDFVHYAHSGHRVIANIVHKRLIELQII